MAQSPKWKVYDARGTYQAACKEIEAAAAVVGFYGPGSTIRLEHAKKYTVWMEGSRAGGDGDSLDSYDRVAEVACAREAEIQRRAVCLVREPNGARRYVEAD